MLGKRKNRWFAVGVVFARKDLDLGHPLSEPQSGFHRLCKAPFDTVSLHETINDNLNIVGFVTFEFEFGSNVLGIGELTEGEWFAGHASAHKPGTGQACQQCLVGSRAPAHDRLKDLKSGAVFESQYLVDDLLGCLFDQTLAVEREQVEPELRCRWKGITGGYLPLAATLAADKSFEAFLAPFAK